MSSRAQATPATGGARGSVTPSLRAVVRFNKRQLRSLEQPRYWVLDQRADRHAWRRGRKRFWIEPTRGDLKRAGFDLEHSALSDPARLTNLVLAMAVTLLWMLYVGHWVRRTGRRRLLSAEHKRAYSLFRLGPDWVRRALALGLPIPIGFTVGPSSLRRSWAELVRVEPES